MSRGLKSPRSRRPTYLPVQPYGQDVAGVAVVADLGALLEVVHIHLPWFGVADHHHQAAGEEALHDVDVRDLIWEGSSGKVSGTAHYTARCTLLH